MFGNRENNLLRRALELYAGKDVLAGVLSEGEAFLFPHARNVELTMLFFDIASVAERGDGLDAVALGDYVTTYAEAMTNAVADTGGTPGRLGHAFKLVTANPLMVLASI